MITGLLAAIAVAGSLANLVVIIAVARNRKVGKYLNVYCIPFRLWWSLEN